MVLKQRIVRFLRDSKAKLVTSEDVVSKFVMHPSQRVRDVRVFGFRSPRRLRPVQCDIQLASFLRKNISEAIGGASQARIDFQSLRKVLLRLFELALAGIHSALRS